jgi:hypothetical protein
LTWTWSDVLALLVMLGIAGWALGIAVLAVLMVGDMNSVALLLGVALFEGAVARACYLGSRGR